MPVGLAGRLLLVVAHPDDETFGCGSLLLHAAAAGTATGVVCATRGEAGEPPAGGRLDAGDLGRIREAELREAAAVLGVSWVDVLDFRDSGMAGPAGPETLLGAPVQGVAEHVRERIERFRPTVLVTLDASDGHRDHARIRDATLAAADSSAWQVERIYLHCLPRSLMRQWVAHMSQVDPSWAHLRGEVPGTPDDRITTVIDTAGHIGKREQAIRVHASQRSPYDGLPDELRRQFLTAARLQRLRPPWRGGSLETDLG